MKSLGGEVAAAVNVNVNVADLRTFNTTVRRNVDQVHHQQQQRGSVCRNLFGTVPDPDENRRFVENQLGLLRLEQNRRWNFDFECGTPLLGRYEWEPVIMTTTTTTCTDTTPMDQCANAVHYHIDNDDEDRLNDERLLIGKQPQITMPVYFPRTPQRKRLASDDERDELEETQGKLVDIIVTDNVVVSKKPKQ